MVRASVFSQETGGHAWEMAFRDPPASVRPHVREYCGYTEATPAALRRHEFPVPRVVAIFEIGPPLRLIDLGNQSRVTSYQAGFAAGMGDVTSLTEHDGFQQGMEVKFTPIGARLFFDLPMAELANQVVGLDEVLGQAGRNICARLREAPDWDARFDLLDDFIAGRIARARARTQPCAWAMDRIEQSGGQLDVGALARELGYSQKHLISLFRDQVGLPPKLVARLFRFDRVMQHVRSGAPVSWAEIAADCGYYDQAHLIRDVRRFTGTTPTGARALVGDLALLPAA